MAKESVVFLQTQMLKVLKIRSRYIIFGGIFTGFGYMPQFFGPKIWSCEFLFANLPTFNALEPARGAAGFSLKKRGRQENKKNKSKISQ